MKNKIDIYRLNVKKVYDDVFNHKVTDETIKKAIKSNKLAKKYNVFHLNFDIKQLEKMLIIKKIKKSDIYFNVQGIDPNRERLSLGYTSDPVAWCLNSNGWDINKLIFVAMIKK